MSILPGLAQFRGYQREWLRGDVLAGVTVAAYLVPQVMAYATVAGLPPVVGLWAALAPLAVYAVLGSSRQLSVGPESTTALMTATALAPLAAGDPGRYAALAAAVALLVGAICFVAGLVRIGFLADLLSRPVLVGYMTGVAVIMIGGQLGKVTGVSVEGDEFVDQVRSFIKGLGGAHWPTIALSVAVLVVLLTLARVVPRLPGPLIAILLATAVVAVFSLDRNGIRVIGEIPSGLPTPGLPGIGLSELSTLVIPAAGIAIVAFSDNVLTARTFAARHGQRVDANAELRALGVCNVGTGLLHGFPVSSSGSRTALGDALGSRTQLYSVVTLVFVLAGDGGRARRARELPDGGTGGIGGVRRAAAGRCAGVQAAGAIPPQRADPRPRHDGVRAAVRCALRRAGGHRAVDPRSAAPSGPPARRHARIRPRSRGHA